MLKPSSFKHAIISDVYRWKNANDLVQKPNTMNLLLNFLYLSDDNDMVRFLENKIAQEIRQTKIVSVEE